MPWTPLSPSRTERVVRQVARALALAAGAALMVAAHRVDPVDPFLGCAALLSILVGLIVRPSVRRAIEVGVDRHGRVTARPAGKSRETLEQELQCVYAAPWLITLKRGTMWIPIWPDSVPGNTFRRLWVHIRWSSGRQPADLPAATAPGQPE